MEEKISLALIQQALIAIFSGVNQPKGNRAFRVGNGVLQTPNLPDERALPQAASRPITPRA